MANEQLDLQVVVDRLFAQNYALTKLVTMMALTLHQMKTGSGPEWDGWLFPGVLRDERDEHPHTAAEKAALSYLADCLDATLEGPAPLTLTVIPGDKAD